MATTHWRTGHTVADIYSLPDVGWSFYQLVRMLLPAGLNEEEQLQHFHGHIRFKASLKTDFPPGEIRDVSQVNGDASAANNVNNQIWEITAIKNNVSGLSGPIPEPFNEMLRDNVSDGNGAMGAFFDLFNQRLQILRYFIRASTDSSLASKLAQHSHRGKFMLALSGNYFQQHRQIYQQSESTLIGLSGSLANRRLSLPVVRQLLSNVMDLNLIKMNSLVGRWLNVDQSDHIQLGVSNHRLSDQATLGSRVWDQQAVFELVLGPLTFNRLERLIPGGVEHASLKKLLNWISDCRCDCKVTLICSEGGSNNFRLSSSPEKGKRLGLVSWLPDKQVKQRNVSFMVNTVDNRAYH